MKHRKLTVTKTKAANILGLSTSYFYTCNVVLFNFFMYHGKGDLVKGYIHYKEKYVNKIKEKYEAIFYTFDTSYQFAKNIKNLNLYDDIYTTAIAIDKLLTNVCKNLTGLHTMKKIIYYIENKEFIDAQINIKRLTSELEQQKQILKELKDAK